MEFERASNAILQSFGTVPLTAVGYRDGRRVFKGHLGGDTIYAILGNPDTFGKDTRTLESLDYWYSVIVRDSTDKVIASYITESALMRNVGTLMQHYLCGYGEDTDGQA